MTDSTAELLAELMRARVLFQARTIAMVIGAPMPRPEGFKR